MNSIVIALSFIFVAGILNGSFALPTKYVTKWKFENIWLQFAIWAFVILPWVVILFMAPQVFSIYAAAPASFLWIIFIGGLFFGIGQMCFALALHMIGLGLGFVINLGLGIGLGFLLPLVIQHPQQIFTPFGYVTLIGTAVAVLGLIISNYAGMLRDRDKKEAIELQAAEQDPTEQKYRYGVGVLLAVLAGFSSAGQNFVFSFTYGLQQIALNMGASKFGAANIIWPLYLLCGFIPYALYMIYLQHKNGTFSNYRKTNVGKYHLFALIMGAFWYGSLLFYSKASQLIGTLGPLVGWPIFMVLIILTASFWGWKHNEWEHSSAKAKSVMRYGLLCLFAAIIILAYSSTL